MNLYRIYARAVHVNRNTTTYWTLLTIAPDKKTANRRAEYNTSLSGGGVKWILDDTETLYIFNLSASQELNAAAVSRELGYIPVHADWLESKAQYISLIRLTNPSLATRLEQEGIESKPKRVLDLQQ